ncbi:MAG: BadF/BadG/BcrA/BcrD ATPase family protein [Acidimicrobiia bacterium]
MTTTTYLGIDGGGSGSRARLEDDAGTMVLERFAGPINPKSVSVGELDGALRTLLGGYPPPVSVVACFAGVAASRTRGLVGARVRAHLAGARLRLEPDFAVVLRCFDEAVTVCVQSGTGSIVSSKDDSGAVITSGGLGYVLGDHGSAFRLGRRLLDRYLAGPGLEHELEVELCAALDVAEAGDVVAHTYASPAPAAYVARAAPVLTGAATRGCEWAHDLVRIEMAGLALTTARHLHAYAQDRAVPTVGIVGGSWSSAVVRAAFADALAEAGVPDHRLVAATRRPVDAAVAIAREEQR